MVDMLFIRRILVKWLELKSRNILISKGKVASWIGIPTSVAIPFGVLNMF